MYLLYFLCTFFKFTDPEVNKKSTGLVTVNAENLMTAVHEVLKATESAFIKVPQEAHLQFTCLN